MVELLENLGFDRIIVAPDGLYSQINSEFAKVRTELKNAKKEG